MIDTKRVHAILRKAGISRADWRPSHQIIGYGSWSRGYILKSNDNYLTLKYFISKNAKMKEIKEELAKIADVFTKSLPDEDIISNDDFILIKR